MVNRFLNDKVMIFINAQKQCIRAFRHHLENEELLARGEQALGLFGKLGDGGHRFSLACHRREAKKRAPSMLVESA